MFSFGRRCVLLLENVCFPSVECMFFLWRVCVSFGFGVCPSLLGVSVCACFGVVRQSEESAESDNANMCGKQEFLLPRCLPLPGACLYVSAFACVHARVRVF